YTKPVALARAGKRRATAGAGQATASSRRPRSPVEPDLLHAAPVVERMMRDEISDVGPLGEIFLAPPERRARDIGLELLLDLPHELQALVAVELLGLLIDPAVDLLVAVVGVVARGPAPVVLVEVHVGIVDARRGQVGADQVVAPRERGEPRGR